MTATQAHEAGPTQPATGRVTTLELFFDLVFVFTITQLTTVLVDHPNGRGLGQVGLMLAVIWWMYGGYAWLTNAVATDTANRRLLLLGGMAAFLVLALSIPGAFGDSGVAFGLAYVAVIAVHTALFTRHSSTEVVEAILGVARYNVVLGVLVLAGGIAGGTAQYVLWALACLIWLTPKVFFDNSGFNIAPGHFVERHGLVIIVAIGESVVAIGIGAQGLPVDAGLVGVALLGLALSAELWWSYFGGDDTRAERAMASASPTRRAQMAIDAFGYAHWLMLLGIVAIAAALKTVIGHASDTVALGPALFLGGGLAAFLLGDVAFRASLRIGPARWRGVAAVLALATVPLGTAVAGVVQLAALVLVVGLAIARERAQKTQRVAVSG
ncbi:MAG TPA: low temperature requirement protein A [Solirubrobacteraceae bacterium]|nr:low temperature requirement protein A [Solirubrobacteraceae bacterium]